MSIPIQQTLLHSFERIEDKYNREADEGCTSTGFEPLDDVLRGIHAGDLIIFCGFPDSYKTTLVSQILIHNIIIEKKSALLVNPELSELQITNKLLALTAEMHVDKLIGGMFDKEEWFLFRQRLQFLGDSKLIISDRKEKATSAGVTDHPNRAIH